jgi:hypothetical protein
MRRARLLPVVVLTLLPAAAWPQGVPLGPEFRVNTFTTNSQWFPAVAADALGNFVVLWASSTQDYAATSGVFGQRYTSGGEALGPEFRVNTYTIGSQGAAAVASDASGNFVVVWGDNLQDGSPTGVFGQRFASSGAPAGSEFRINTYTPFSQDGPSVAADAAGNFVVVWHSQFQDGSYFGVFGQRYASTGTPIGPEFRVNTTTLGDQATPRIGSDPSGNFVVVWTSETGDGSSYGVFGQRFAASGAPLGAQFRINTYTTNSQGSPDVDVDPAGNFVVVWNSGIMQDGSGFGIFGQRFAATGAPAGPEFRVNTNVIFDQFFPSVAVDGSGNFVVAWQSFFWDGDGDGIFGQRYDATGTPLGGEFRVNTTATYDQERPVTMAQDDGHFLVLWSSWTQGSTGWNVFGQRYAPIVPVELMHLSIE